ncbi:SPL10 [Scenedesmus sp. PABB004]|nr:SPL10 [Scenedesmus sp. PABB004]
MPRRDARRRAPCPPAAAVPGASALFPTRRVQPPGPRTAQRSARSATAPPALGLRPRRRRDRRRGRPASPAMAPGPERRQNEPAERPGPYSRPGVKDEPPQQQQQHAAAAAPAAAPSEPSPAAPPHPPVPQAGAAVAAVPDPAAQAVVLDAATQAAIQQAAAAAAAAAIAQQQAAAAAAVMAAGVGPPGGAAAARGAALDPRAPLGSLGPGLPAFVKVSGESDPRKVAGKLAHTCRDNAAPAMLTIGTKCINQAVKAIAIARGYLAESQLELTFQTAFREGGTPDKPSVALYLSKHPNSHWVPQPGEVELAVSGTSQPTVVAGALAARCRDGAPVCLVGIGMEAVTAAVMAIGQTRLYLEADGKDVRAWPEFVKVAKASMELNAIKFHIHVPAPEASPEASPRILSDVGASAAAQDQQQQQAAAPPPLASAPPPGSADEPAHCGEPAHRGAVSAQDASEPADAAQVTHASLPQSALAAAQLMQQRAQACAGLALLSDAAAASGGAAPGAAASGGGAPGAAASRGGAPGAAPPRPGAIACQVPGCSADLWAPSVTAYFRRHRMCGAHARAPHVVIGGAAMRFCQQCGALHGVADFDGDRRSCRVQLGRHNTRRRKAQAAEPRRAGDGGGGGSGSASPGCDRSMSATAVDGRRASSEAEDPEAEGHGAAAVVARHLGAPGRQRTQGTGGAGSTREGAGADAGRLPAAAGAVAGAQQAAAGLTWYGGLPGLASSLTAVRPRARAGAAWPDAATAAAWPVDALVHSAPVPAPPPPASAPPSGSVPVWLSVGGLRRAIAAAIGRGSGPGAHALRGMGLSQLLLVCDELAAGMFWELERAPAPRPAAGALLAAAPPPTHEAAAAAAGADGQQLWQLLQQLARPADGAAPPALQHAAAAWAARGAEGADGGGRAKREPEEQLHRAAAAKRQARSPHDRGAARLPTDSDSLLQQVRQRVAGRTALDAHSAGAAQPSPAPLLLAQAELLTAALRSSALACQPGVPPPRVPPPVMPPAGRQSPGVDRDDAGAARVGGCPIAAQAALLRMLAAGMAPGSGGGQAGPSAVAEPAGAAGAAPSADLLSLLKQLAGTQ